MIIYENLIKENCQVEILISVMWYWTEEQGMSVDNNGHEVENKFETGLD